MLFFEYSAHEKMKENMYNNKRCCVPKKYCKSSFEAYLFYYKKFRIKMQDIKSWA